MTPLASQKEFCPSFFAGLVGLTRARYEAKVNMFNGIDLCTLCTGPNMMTDVNLLPIPTHADIVKYLVLSNHVSLTEGKCTGPLKLTTLLQHDKYTTVLCHVFVTASATLPVRNKYWL